MPVDSRIDAPPLPVILHMASVIPYSLFGAFQLPSLVRPRHSRCHRTAGGVLVPLALVVSFSGL